MGVITGTAFLEYCEYEVVRMNRKVLHIITNTAVGGAEMMLYKLLKYDGGVFQHRADQRFFRSNPLIGISPSTVVRQIEGRTELVRITTGKQRHAARSAEGMHDVSRREGRALLGELIKLRRQDVSRSLKPHVGIAEIVGQYEYDIRYTLGIGF